MEDRSLEDAEALRLLLDETVSLAHDARHLADLVGRLTHTIARFAQGYVEDAPTSPMALLTEIGAVMDRCTAVELGHVGLADALRSLRFALVPNPAPLAAIQAGEMATLRARLARRGHRARPQPVGGT